MPKIPDYLKNHSQYEKSDYLYFYNKGWSNQEIKKKWDEEKANGADVCHHKDIHKVSLIYKPHEESSIEEIINIEAEIKRAIKKIAIKHRATITIS